MRTHHQNSLLLLFLRFQFCVWLFFAFGGLPTHAEVECGRSGRARGTTYVWVRVCIGWSVWGLHFHLVFILNIPRFHYLHSAFACSTMGHGIWRRYYVGMLVWHQLPLAKVTLRWLRLETYVTHRFLVRRFGCELVLHQSFRDEKTPAKVASSRKHLVLSNAQHQAVFVPHFCLQNGFQLITYKQHWLVR